MNDRATVALVVDDHSVVRLGLRRLLAGIGITVIEEADNGIDAISRAKVTQPDIMLLDVSMPHAGGIEVFTEVRRWSPDTRVVVFTGVRSDGLLAQLVEFGVHGAFLKSDAPEELEAGLSAILQGGRIISRSVQELLAQAGGGRTLTRREGQILALLVDGYTTIEISERLCISPHTVRNHRANLMSKLDVHSISELMALAIREGLLDKHDPG
jgi:DNA-binding NarL/FixJ family response regulator